MHATRNALGILLAAVAVLGAVAPARCDGPNLFANGGLDTGINGWLGGGLAWSPEDRLGSPHSGSLLVANPSTTPSASAVAYACFPIAPGPLVFGASSWLEGGEGDFAAGALTFYVQANCQGVGSEFLPLPRATSAHWTTIAGAGVAPAGAQSALYYIGAFRGAHPVGTSTAYFDDFFVRSGTCAPSATQLCLEHGRFAVTVKYTANGQTGQGQAVPAGDQSGKFWFFAPTNVELDVKALAGCGVNQRYWFFAAGLTNVKVTITVRDTLRNVTKTYANPAGHVFTTVTDTSAFATCP